MMELYSGIVAPADSADLAPCRMSASQLSCSRKRLIQFAQSIFLCALALRIAIRLLPRRIWTDDLLCAKHNYPLAALPRFVSWDYFSKKHFGLVKSCCDPI